MRNGADVDAAQGRARRTVIRRKITVPDGRFTDPAATFSAMESFRYQALPSCVLFGSGTSAQVGEEVAALGARHALLLCTGYSGSEVTPVLGQTESGRKSTLRSDKVLPETVIYDVDLTMSLPVGVSAASGVNALAHAVEALWSRERNPVTTVLARESITALTSALPDVCDRPDDRPARSDALYGAWLAGICLATVGMALHHKLCHVLGGTFDLPHAQTHAVLLPYVVAFNAGSAPRALTDLQDVLGSSDASATLREFTGRLGLPRSLADLGMPEDGIAQAADLAARDPYWNPRPLDRAALAALIRQAWSGAAPAPIAD